MYTTMIVKTFGHWALDFFWFIAVKSHDLPIL